MSSKIAEELKRMNITIHENFEMQEWNEGTWESGGILTSVYFTKTLANDDEEEIHFDCCVSNPITILYIG